MPAEREAREPVPRAAKRIRKSRPWVLDIPLIAKFRDDSSRHERIARYRRGRLSEFMAAATLMAKGYRILARRCRTPYGEIDLIATRASSLVFVEVKRRTTREEAEAALSSRQAQRMARAAEFWINCNPRYRDHEQRMDAILVLPRCLPKHLPGALGIALPDRR